MMFRLTVAVAAFVSGVWPCGAAEVVVFEDGRGLVVERWEADAGTITLELEGGSAMAVPASRIVSIRPYVRPEKEPDRPPAADEAWRGRAGEFADLIADAAERYDLPAGLLAAMALVESNYDPFAVSPKGACGILQLLPETADRFGVADVFDARSNLDGGAKYLRWLLDRFEGRTELALAAYNAGENAVDRHDGIPPYRETRQYVVKVMQHAGLQDAAGRGGASRARTGS